MPIDLEKFKMAYDKWVRDSLPDYRAGRMKEIVRHYPLIAPDDIPWTPYRGRLAEQTVALITSGGLYLKERQPAFDTESIHGDPSFRELPKTVRPDELGIAHAHYDHRLAEEDINTIFPIDRFVELENEGIIGRLADRHFSFSYVNDVVTLVTQTAPAVIRRLMADKIDILFLVPV